MKIKIKNERKKYETIKKLLTAFNFDDAELSVHREILQVHGAGGSDGQSAGGVDEKIHFPRARGTSSRRSTGTALPEGRWWEKKQGEKIEVSSVFGN